MFGQSDKHAINSHMEAPFMENHFVRLILIGIGLVIGVACSRVPKGWFGAILAFLLPPLVAYGWIWIFVVLPWKGVDPFGGWDLVMTIYCSVFGIPSSFLAFIVSRALVCRRLMKGINSTDKNAEQPHCGNGGGADA